MMQRDGRQITMDGGISVITSPDGRMTTITDNGRVTTLTVGTNGVVTATVNGRPITSADPSIGNAIYRVASASTRQEPRVIRELPTVRVNGRALSAKEVLAGSAVAGAGAMFVAMMLLMAFGRLVRTIFRRKPAAMAGMPNVAPRLDRLEQAVESIAVEMERVAESQRFSARLLSERLPATSMPNGARAAAERVITPH